MGASSTNTSRNLCLEEDWISSSTMSIPIQSKGTEIKGIGWAEVSLPLEQLALTAQHEVLHARVVYGSKWPTKGEVMGQEHHLGAQQCGDHHLRLSLDPPV